MYIYINIYIYIFAYIFAMCETSSMCISHVPSNVHCPSLADGQRHVCRDLLHNLTQKVRRIIKKTSQACIHILGIYIYIWTKRVREIYRHTLFNTSYLKVWLFFNAEGSQQIAYVCEGGYI